MKQTKSSRRRKAGQGWSLQLAEPESAGIADTGTVQQIPPLARLRLEKRRGKPVTMAALEGVDATAQRALGKELKTRCGSGGTVKEGTLELQGDHREALRRLLAERGLRVKG